VTRRSGRDFPILVGSQDIYAGRVVKMRVDTIELKDGRNVRREVVEHPGAVVIVPVDGDGRILWIRQYRYAVDEELLELPAGTIEKGESPEVCARREIAEETGFEALTLETIGGFFSAPGFCTEYLHAFVARDLRPATAHPDEDEVISLNVLTEEESLAHITSGEVRDAKSIAAIFLYLRSRAEG
jgi:ADP-ribose pyrophosphatase